MFRNWGFLLGEIWVLLAIAAALGLFVGWLIWAGRRLPPLPGAGDSAETERLRRDLAECQRGGADHAARVAALEAQLKAADARADRLAAATAAPVAALAQVPEAAPEAAPVPASVGVRPAALTQARAGGADDLKLIKGIGPKMEKLCNSLGFYHFDQIAAWTAAEVAWVDENLEGFKGRVTRDDWVAQARDLAAGLPPRPMADVPDRG